MLSAVLIKDAVNRERLAPSARSGETFGYEEVTGSHENTRVSYSESGLGTYCAMTVCLDI